MSEFALPGISYPRRSLRVSIFLIAIECLMLAYPSGNWLVTGVLFLWGVSRWWTIRQGWCLTMPMSWNALFLATLFVAKYSFAPQTFSTDAPFVNTELAHEIGCWLVAMQILLLHDSASLKRVPVGFAALGCLVILCAGDVRLHSISRTAMLSLMILFVGGLGWFAHAGRNWGKVDQHRRLRRFLLVITLALAGVPTVYAAQAWHEHERDLETLLLKVMKAFEGDQKNRRIHVRSGLTRLSDGRIVDPEKPIVRVTQQGSEPLYLRAMACDTYRNTAWNPVRPRTRDISPRDVEPDRGLPSTSPLFEIRPSQSRQWRSVIVDYLAKDDPALLTTIDTAELKIHVSTLRIDSLENLSLIDETLPDSLTFYIPEHPQPVPASVGDRSPLQIPAELELIVQQIAKPLFGGKSSDAEKIRAVESFFRENFQYQIGLEVPRREDPLHYFLKERPAAHCEYFASSAALLLRVADIPTRYVTGYVPAEQHPNGIWIARRKDAHAWVEAYDSDLHQWVIVEATPSAGLPERRKATWKNNLIESWRAWYWNVRDTLAVYGTWSAISLILQSTKVRIVLAGILLASWWGISRRFRRERGELRRTDLTRQHAFHQWLVDLEEGLAEQGLQRLPHETLLRFRDRILNSPGGEQLRPMADWYAEYSRIRYNEAEQTADRVAALELSWQSLTTQVGRIEPRIPAA